MKPYESPWMDDDLRVLRDSVSRFVETEMMPHEPRWRQQKHVDRATWRVTGQAGFLLLDVPVEYGGGGGDFRHESILYEETARRGISGFGQGVHSIAAHYVLNYGSEEQKQRWLPRMASGELIGAIAMTEPGAGSDLKAIRTRAVRDGDDYVVNGSKMFITNGFVATILMLVVRTDPNDRSRGLSILMVETEGRQGYRVGKVLDKMGLTAQDTSELYFEDMRVPASCLLGGEEGKGMHMLMGDLPYERLTIALGGVAAMEGARGNGQIRQGAPGVRPAGRRLPEHTLQAGRGSHPGTCRAGVRRSLHRATRRGHARHRDGRDGQVVGHGHAAKGDRRLPAAVRRVRLHERVPDLPDVH
jgi:acyl-CoA dehydrogenase